MSQIKVHFPRINGDHEHLIDIARALGVDGSTPAQGRPGPEQPVFDRLNELAGKWFFSSGLDEADIVFYPYRAEDHRNDVIEVSLEAKARNLDCFFLSWGDVDVPISVPHGTVFRHSLSASTRLACEAAMPAFCADPLAGLEFKARSWQPTPTVGFCGFVSTPLKRLVYRLAGRTQKALGLILRAKTLGALQRYPGVHTKFILRNSYWAGATGRGFHDPAAQFAARKEFLDNLMGSDYTVCIRGAGNFSYRFYESLAVGRIPLLINTDCVLPFEDQINWKDHCVWVEESEISRAGEILAAFHGKLSDEQFQAIQTENRRLWEQWLCPQGFYRHVLKARDGPINSR